MDDPAQARRTLSDIAFAWGFSDMTHFSRVFKKMYGLLPSEYRRLSPAERFNIVAVANDAAP
jgi:AraC-like DNA-binding protein